MGGAERRERGRGRRRRRWRWRRAIAAPSRTEKRVFPLQLRELLLRGRHRASRASLARALSGRGGGGGGGNSRRFRPRARVLDPDGDAITASARSNRVRGVSFASSSAGACPSRARTSPRERDCVATTARSCFWVGFLSPRYSVRVRVRVRARTISLARARRARLKNDGLIVPSQTRSTLRPPNFRKVCDENVTIGRRRGEERARRPRHNASRHRDARHVDRKTSSPSSRDSRSS